MGAAVKIAYDERYGIAECGGCHVMKSFSEFHPARTRGNRARQIQYHCKACVAKRGKGPGKIEAQRRYAAKNREALNRYANEYYHGKKKHDPKYKARSSEYGRWYRRLKKYGITKDQYVAMLEQQQGRCAICGVEAGFDLRVDHDHATGEVRELLCAPCNAGIGSFKESIAALNAATRYLHRHGAAGRQGGQSDHGLDLALSAVPLDGNVECKTA